ncbi:MAG: hypothetical protein P1V97_23900 [Planctomycetota bacterium]|nr:hypothetical protein [Planctomycetota bacterium]
MSVYSEAILFWGFGFTTPHQAPWHGSSDSPSDHALEWQERLKRRLSERQSNDEDVPHCSIEFYDSFDNQRYFVCVNASVIRCEDTSATRITQTHADPSWEDMLMRFCDLLDIPWSTPGWNLAAQLIH